MKVVVALVVALSIAGIAFALRDGVSGGDVNSQYQTLMQQDDELMAQYDNVTEEPSWWAAFVLHWKARRLEHGYRSFLKHHPEHVPGMIAFGGFLFDQRREDEAVVWWKKAVATNPRAAYAYNNLAVHYGHEGHANEALVFYQLAFELQPREPMFRLNWATTCSMYRNNSAEVYGWDTNEIFTRSLEQFRIARDLRPDDYAYASAYAETFYLMTSPDWAEAYDAWAFCLGQELPLDERQRVFGHLARVCMRLQRYDEARSWLQRIDEEGLSGLKNILLRRVHQLECGDSGTDS